MAETLEYVISVRGGPAGAAAVREVESAVGSAGGSVKRFGGVTEEAGRRSGRFTSGLKGMLVQLGLVAGAYKAVSAAKGAVAYTKSLAEGSAALDKATGLGIQKSSQLLTVSEALGVPFGSLTTAMRSLSKQAVKQVEGTSKQATAFDKLGISTKFVRGHQHDFNAILDKTVEKLHEMPGGFQRNTVASEVFGKGFAKLNPLLGEGVGHLEHYLGIAKKYGAELKGAGAAQQLDELREAEVESKLASDGLRISFTKLAGPSMVQLLKSFARLKNDVRTGNWSDFSKQVGKGAEVAEKALVIFEERAIEGMGQTGPKLAKALWRGFSHASLQNQALMIGAILTKFGVAGKLFNAAGGALAGKFAGGFRRRAVPSVEKAAMRSAEVGAAETAAFDAAGTSLGVAFGAAFLAAAAGAGLGLLLNKLLPNGIFGHPEHTPKEAETTIATGAKPGSKAFYVDPSGTVKPNRGAAHTRAEGDAAPTTAAGDAFRERIRHRNEAIERRHHGHVRAHGSDVEVRDVHVHVSGRKLFTVNLREQLQAQAAGE